MNQPAGDERLLLRAALLRTGGPDAWRAYLARHAGIDHLDGDGLAVLPMVFGNLSGVVPSIPEMGRLRGIYRRTWYANQMLLHAASQAVAALDAAGVDVMLAGGCALAALHGDPGLRSIAAVDLAITAGDRRRSLHVLAGLGWFRRPAGSPARALHDWPQVPLVRARGEHLVVHCIVPRLDRAGAEERRDTGTAIVGGVTVRIPNATDQLLVACIGRRRGPAPAATSLDPGGRARDPQPGCPNRPISPTGASTRPGCHGRAARGAAPARQRL